jgi:hypothetical protein
LLRWDLAFLALIFVTPLLDLIRLLLRGFGVDMRRSPTKLVWRDIKRPFRGIWQGDISALQVVRVRVLTRAFIGSHIVGVVEQLKLVTERTLLITAMSCHIEKQRILSAAGAYELETAPLRPRSIATFEPPLDVAFAAAAAAAAFLTVYFYASLTVVEPDPFRPDADRDRRPRDVSCDRRHRCGPALVSAQATGRPIRRRMVVAGQSRLAARARPRPLTRASPHGA